MCLTVGLVAAFALQSLSAAEEPVFSGPQEGEVLPPFKVNSVLGKTAGQDVNLVEQAAGKPILLVFVHARTRPGFGLTNLLTRYAAQRAEDGLHTGVIMLTDDVTATEQWMKVVQKHFNPEKVMYGISPEGQEGPGAYGLNRNVTLTVLVGTEGKVTANFALVQPSVQADGPKILKAIVDVLGGGEVPTIDELGGERYQNADRGRMNARPGERDAQLTTLMRDVINKRATAEDVEAAVAKVNEYVAKNEAARQQLGQMTTTVVKSGKIENYGTSPAQDAIREWAKKYGELTTEIKADPESDK